MSRPKAIERMIEAFRTMPGIGPKMAERLSYHILRAPDNQVSEIVNAISDAKGSVKICGKCFNITQSDPCDVCADTSRDKSMLCVVETPQDLTAFSTVKQYYGLYFVLGGALSPLDGVGPNDIRVKELLTRLKNDSINEVIIATDTDSKGEITALFLAEQIKPIGIKVTRIGYGLPMGGDLEYADEVTLTRALQGRREM